MPSISNDLIRPPTYSADHGKNLDFSPGHISRVKNIASASLEGSESFFSSRSLTISLITIGLGTLVVYYIASTILKFYRDSSNTSSAPPPTTNKGAEPQLSSDESPKKLHDPGKDHVQPHEQQAKGSVPLPPPTTDTSPPASIPISPIPFKPTSEEGQKEPVNEEALSKKNGIEFASVEDSSHPLGDYNLPLPGEPYKAVDSTPILAPPLIPTQTESSSSKGPEGPSKPPASSEFLKSPRDSKRKSTDLSSNPTSPRIEKEKLASFYDLSLTDEQARSIAEIVTIMGDTSVLMLGLQKPKLTQLGTGVLNVHPLRFLGVVLANPELKKFMIEIENSSLKWQGFLQGKLSGALSVLNDSNPLPGFAQKCDNLGSENFLPYVEEFCQLVIAPLEIVIPLVKNKEWEKLVKFLIHR